MRRTASAIAAAIAFLLASPAAAMPQRPVGADAGRPPSPIFREPDGPPRAAWAGTVTGPTEVIGMSPDEEGYAESDAYQAWAAGEGARRRRRFTVYARSKSGGPRWQVNRPGTQAFMGGIDGSLLAFQEARFDKGRSSIFLYNMEFDTRSNPGPKVNSKAWEYWPTVSGDWLLFFRTNAKDTRRRAFLYNTTTQERRLLDLSKGKARLLGGGQVNGDWAAWMKCGKTCNVFRYDIMGDAKEKVPNPGAKYQYGAAVDPDGTVYYGRSGPHCGQHVKIWKYPVGGSPVRLLVFPKRHDFGRAFVYRTGSENHYSFDYTRCRDQSSDIYEIVDNLA